MKDIIDPRDPGVQADPYPIYRRLQREAPVHFQLHEEDAPVWWISRYDDIVELIRDPRMVVEDVPQDDYTPPPPPEALTDVIALVDGMMLRRDPPDHTRLRGLVSRAFTPRTVERLRGRIQDLVDELLWENAGGTHMDLIADLAAPLPVMVIAELLGLPPEDRKQLKAWSDDIVPMLDGSLRDDNVASIFRATVELKAYLAEIVRDRRSNPRDDLISGLVAAQDERDALSDIEVIATSILILGAGHETTTNLIGNGMLALLAHKDQKEHLLAEPDRIANAVEEMLRFDSPVQVTSRHPIEDIEFRGCTLKKGQEVDLLFGAANRDPGVFADPNRFDIGRENIRHLSFGHGTHFCLGAQLARLEAQIAIGTLVARRPALELAGEPERRPGFVLRGVNTLPVRLGSR